MPPVLVLLDPRGRKHAVQADGAMVRAEGIGTFDVGRLQASVGRTVRIGGKAFLVLEPSGRDLHDCLGRAAQTVSPKDAACILYEADIGPGHTVVEAGSGSGGLTTDLARAVGPTGRVVSYDLREDFLAVARRNVGRAGVADWVDFRRGDVREGIRERDVDAVVLDMPDPWAAIPTAWEALRRCGHLATLSPNMEQVKETVTALRKKPFIDVRTVELIEREMEVREIGVRPSFAPLGHTGYLTFARKVLDTF